jgi:hypothetical protein
MLSSVSELVPPVSEVEVVVVVEVVTSVSVKDSVSVTGSAKVIVKTFVKTIESMVIYNKAFLKNIFYPHSI